MLTYLRNIRNTFMPSNDLLKFKTKIKWLSDCMKFKYMFNEGIYNQYHGNFIDCFVHLDLGFVFDRYDSPFALKSKINEPTIWSKNTPRWCKRFTVSKQLSTSAVYEYDGRRLGCLSDCTVFFLQIFVFRLHHYLGKQFVPLAVFTSSSHISREEWQVK